MLATRRRPAAAAGHRHGLSSASLRRVGRRLLAAGVRLRPGPGARSRRPWRAGLLRRPDHGAGLRPPAARRDRGRSGGRSDPLAHRGACLERPRRLPDARHLPRLPPSHRPRPQAVEQRRRPVRPRRPRWHSPAITLATSWSGRSPSSPDGGLLCCALDTELLGHWWYEGPAWLAAVLEEAPRQGLELRHRERGHRARRAAAGRAGAVDLGQRQGPVHLGLARGRPHGGRRPPLRAAHRRATAGHASPRAALERAARELLAVQASDWAFMATRELAGDYPARAARGATTSLDAALGALTDSAAVPDPSVRNLAPDLDLAALTSP